MISENIAILRKNRRLTQEKLGEMVGVSRQTIAKWESGESAPDMALGGLLAVALDVTLDDLVNTPMKEGSIEKPPKGKYIFGVVTVGDKGQIVIPVRARRVFHISPGDQLMLLGDEDRGLALVNADFFLEIAEEMRHGEK